MSTINFIFILLFLITMYVLYINGKKIKALPEGIRLKKYLKTAMPSIIIYTLNEGLRFGRGIDYNIYAKDFVYNTGNQYFENGDLGFRYIGMLLQSLGMPFQAFVLLMSFILILSVLIFIRNFKGCAPFALPLFLFLFYTATENLMRWFLGFSFILIGFSFIVQEKKSIKNYIYFTLFSLLSFFFHFAIVIIPIIYIVLIRFKRPLLKPVVSISLFVLIALSFQTSIMLSLKEYLNVFSMLSDKSTFYIDNAEQWLTGGASGLVFSAFPELYKTLLYIMEIILGYKLCKHLDNKYIILYNIFLIGFVILPVANQIELALRYQYLIFIYQFIILAYIIDYYLVSKRLQLNNISYALVIIVFLYYSQRQIRMWAFEEPEYRHLYVWNSEGNDYLDLWSTYYKDMENK